jgi:hypothetical protein
VHDGDGRDALDWVVGALWLWIMSSKWVRERTVVDRKRADV